MQSVTSVKVETGVEKLLDCATIVFCF